MNAPSSSQAIIGAIVDALVGEVMGGWVKASVIPV